MSKKQRAVVLTHVDQLAIVVIQTVVAVNAVIRVNLIKVAKVVNVVPQILERIHVVNDLQVSKASNKVRNVEFVKLAHLVVVNKFAAQIEIVKIHVIHVVQAIHVVQVIHVIHAHVIRLMETVMKTLITVVLVLIIGLWLATKRRIWI